MYQFRDTNEHAYPMEVSVQTIINGVNLDAKVKGFTTLSVHGRELLGKDVTTTEYKTAKIGKKVRTYLNHERNTSSSYDNSYVGSKLSMRNIKVEYSLRADNNRDFREQYEYLNYLLDVSEAEIFFTDDREFYWIGTLSSVEEPDSNGNWVKGSFEFICSMPFKMKAEAERLSFFPGSFEGVRGTVKKKSYFPLRVERAEISLEEDAQKIIVKNETTGQRIIMDGTFSTGDTIIIDFLEGNISTDKGQNLMGTLDITSDLEEFSMTYADTISVDVNSESFIEYREVRL